MSGQEPPLPRKRESRKCAEELDSGLRGNDPMGMSDVPYCGEYPPDFFDFIVIDESDWRGILDSRQRVFLDFALSH
jgi:hypothetical protein